MKVFPETAQFYHTQFYLTTEILEIFSFFENLYYIII